MTETTSSCEWLHRKLAELPSPIRFPFELKDLPKNGIYFFYEDGEKWGHGSGEPRIVRIGTHKDGNFQSRISEHYLVKGASAMSFTKDNPAPKDRSIFRKNLGRAILNKDKDQYLEEWNIDFTTHQNKVDFGSKRDIEKERSLESQITKVLRSSFSFRFILFEGEAERMGSEGLESRLISTVARCGLCSSSKGWLGRQSPDKRISNGKLWLVQHLKSNGLDTKDEHAVAAVVEKTKQWIDKHERGKY
ncbi:MAG: hypothetical protein ABSB56_04570 [Nitrososphaerales archaeon]|jgi:hypothetical protein